MEIKTEEVFHNGDAPFNRIHAAVGVYQNTGQGHQDSLNRYIYSRIPTVKLKNPGKSFLKSESRTSVTFKLKFLALAVYQWQRLGLRSKTIT